MHLSNFSAHTWLQLQYLHLYLQCTCEYNTLCETEAHHALWDQTVWFLFSFIPFVVFILHTHVCQRSNRRNKTGPSQIRLFACKAVWKVQPKYIFKPWRPKFFFQYEIIINVLVMSFRFIWIPMLWVYGHYTYFTLAVRGSTLDIYRRLILTSKINPRAVRVKASITKVVTVNNGFLTIFKSNLTSYIFVNRWKKIRTLLQRLCVCGDCKCRTIHFFKLC